MYDRKVSGMFGRFGSGMGIEICYIQTALAPEMLKNISMIQEVPNSDRWKVRDLFQRDVDKERVRTGLLPWLRNPNKVKFFNPLTLVMLPLSEDMQSVVDGFHVISNTSDHIDASPYYRFTIDFKYTVSQDRIDTASQTRHKPVEQNSPIGQLEWSSERCMVVAVDGQHRLYALKQFYEAGNDDANMDEWSVPVVIAGLHPASTDANQENNGVPMGYLQALRTMFININTQAQPPTAARQIILNDEDVVSVCCQETLEYAHRRDLLPIDQRQVGDLPLLLFDWRGHTKDGMNIRNPGALIETEVLAQWISDYILFVNVEKHNRFKEAFGWTKSEAEYVDTLFENRLDSFNQRILRVRYRKHILPGLTYLVENFKPYKEFIESVRVLEQDVVEKSAGEAAFSKLRYGSHSVLNVSEEEVSNVFDEVIGELMGIQARILPNLINQDIGMRAVVFAFGAMKRNYARWSGSDIDDGWLEYSQWFTSVLNKWYDRDIFDDRQEVLRNIVKNSYGRTINYRIEHARRGLGGLLMVLIAGNSCVEGDYNFPSNGEFDILWKSIGEKSIGGSLRREYFKYYKSTLSEQKKSLYDRHQIEDLATANANRAKHRQLKEIKALAMSGG